MSYHSYYRMERQWLHDSILEDYLCHEEQAKDCIPAEPWLIYSCGVKGAGKRYLIQSLMDDGRLPLLSTIVVDADEVRSHLPEFSTYAKDPGLVSKRMNKEAGYICELLTLAALQAGSNVWIDGPLQDVTWRLQQFETLKSLHPKLKIALIHVTAPLEVIVERNEQQAEITGYPIPLEYTQARLEQIPDRAQAVKSHVDFFCTIHNPGGGRDFDLLEMTWKEFTTNFQQEVEIVNCGKATNVSTMTAVITDDEEEEPTTTTLLAATRPQISTRRLASLQETRFAAKSFRRKRRQSLRRPFSVELSTEENHKSEDNKYYGTHVRWTFFLSLSNHAPSCDSKSNFFLETFTWIFLLGQENTATSGKHWTIPTTTTIPMSARNFKIPLLRNSCTVP